VEDELPDALAEIGPAGLARGHDLSARRLERRPQELDLRRLAGAVEAFEGHEHRARTIRRVRAAVTGGAGFIGSAVVDALVARGDDVTVIDNLSSGKRENVNPAARLVEADIREPLELDADVVFHLAAQADVSTSVARPEYDAEVNVLGTVNVLEAAREAGAQIVFSSTGGAIYGECTRPAREDDPRQPLSPYGVAKLAGEEYLATWNRLHGATHVALRFGNVYGPRQDSGLEGGVVAIFLERMARGEPTTIFGDGEQERDFVYVEDVAAAVLAAVGRAAGVYNVGSGEATSIATLHELCRRVSGDGREPELGSPRAGDLKRSVLDPSRARAELGWTAATPLEDGLRRTWDWLTVTGPSA
jgi:UDP-glucose 4-epimerase